MSQPKSDSEFAADAMVQFAYRLADARTILESAADAMSTVSLQLAEHFPAHAKTDEMRTVLAVAFGKIEQFLRPQG